MVVFTQFFLQFVLAPFWHLAELPASSVGIVLLQGFELPLPSSTLSVGETRSWPRTVTLHVLWWWSYCTRVRLVVVIHTSGSYRN